MLSTRKTSGPKPARDERAAALEAAARKLALQRARHEFGEHGCCSRIHRVADTRYYRCYIAPQSGEPGRLVGKTITVQVQGWESWFPPDLVVAKQTASAVTEGKPA